MLRNKSYGTPKTCEYGDCERKRGAPDRSLMTYGCVLCTVHDNEYQLGNIELPDTAATERKQAAEDRVLG